jgi:DNA-binding protein HU-beta
MRRSIPICSQFTDGNTASFLSINLTATAFFLILSGVSKIYGEITEAKIMTKAELISAVAEKTEFTKKDSDSAVSAVIDAITEALAAGDKVSLVGFGTFEVKERAARNGINPRTKESMPIPASKLPAFKAGKALKDAVCGK